MYRASGLPWWAKVVIKSSLAVLPVPYERVRGCITGYRGAMRDTRYALRVVNEFLEDGAQCAHSLPPDACLLELGPGGSVLSGIIGRSLGFKTCYLIDVGNFASQDVDIYLQIASTLPNCGEIVDALRSNRDTLRSLDEVGIHYRTNGLLSMRKIEKKSVTFSFSNAVLEHVRQSEFTETLTELYSLHQKGSLTVHQIDYRDHLEGGLNNLRFSTRLWESKWFPNSGFYTNRIRHSQFLDVIENTGFEVVKAKTKEWPEIPISRRALASEFRDLSRHDLLVKGARVTLHKPR